jgi:hypothetical protein
MKPFLVVKMAINNVVQDTGPFVVDVGLLNALRVKLTSSGRTNQGGVGPQIFDVTDVLLTPGTYFYAMYGDTDATPTENVSRMALTVQTCQACGVQQEAVGSGSSLPAIATFAGGVVGNSYVPYIAIAGKTTF